MKNKSIVIGMFIAALLAMGINGAEQKELTDEEQFKQIEEYIDQLKQEIEDHYADRLVELQAKVDAEIRLLDVANKGIYSTLAEQTKIAETVLQINGLEDIPFGFSRPDESIDDIINSHSHETVRKAPRLFAIVQSQIAEAKSDILADYEQLAVDIEKQQRYALTVRTADLEKKLKNSVATAKPKPVHGMIAAILYSKQKPSAIIGSQLVHEKDTINNVKVVRIYPERIKFETKRKSWYQKVKEPPSKYW
jgi:hypothetical protein